MKAPPLPPDSTYKYSREAVTTLVEFTDLKDLIDVLTRLSQGEIDAWLEIVGPADILRRTLHNAILHACNKLRISFSLLDNDLEKCWDLLGQKKSGHAVRDTLNVSAEIARDLLRNARSLVSTAGAALAACYSIPDRFVFWAGKSVISLTSPAQLDLPLTAVDSEVMACWYSTTTGQKFAEQACTTLSQQGWPIGAALCWILYWLNERRVEPAALRVLRVPVGGYHHVEKRGFLMDLELYLLKTEGFLVDHPDNVLMPMDENFRHALRQGWEFGKQQGVCWSFSMRGTELSDFSSLQGASLGAAAAAGFGLLRAKRDYDSSIIILARYLPSESQSISWFSKLAPYIPFRPQNARNFALEKVEHESQKLDAVALWNKDNEKDLVRIAIVAKNSGITESKRNAFKNGSAKLEIDKTKTLALTRVTKSNLNVPAALKRWYRQLSFFAVGYIAAIIIIYMIATYVNNRNTLTGTDTADDKIDTFQQVAVPAPNDSAHQDDEHPFLAKWHYEGEETPPGRLSTPVSAKWSLYKLEEKIPVPVGLTTFHVRISGNKNTKTFAAYVDNPEGSNLISPSNEKSLNWRWDPDLNKFSTREMQVKVRLWIKREKINTITSNMAPDIDAQYHFDRAD